jgi:hypothetical protein
MGNQISAGESVLQMANRASLRILQDFNKDPTIKNASRLVTIPALYNVLTREVPVQALENGQYPEIWVLLCQWVHDRGQTVLQKLLVHENPPVINVPYNKINWESVSCFHNTTIMPKIILKADILLMAPDWMLLQHVTDPSSTGLPAVDS